MATVLSVGDIAIVQYNSSTTDSFTFVFPRRRGRHRRQFHRRLAGRRRIRAGEGNATATAAAATRRYHRHADGPQSR
jgi:hypothetical protein